MSSGRVRSLAAVLLLALLPVASQAQFGKLLTKAKAIRSSIDSAKAVVDTSKTVIVAAKGAVNDATSGLPAPDSSAGAAGGSHAKSSGTPAASGPSASTGATTSGATGTVAAKTRAKATATTAAAPAKPAAQPAAATRSASRRPALAGGTPLTEAVFSQFMRGAAAENSYRKSKPNDAQGALNAAVAASGLSKADFASVQTKVTMYGAYASQNRETSLNGMFTAGDLTVLNAHKSDIAQLAHS